MKNFYASLCYVAFLFLASIKLTAQTSFVYHDAREFLFVGQGFKDAPFYQRLPMRYKDKVRSELWEESLRPTGIAVYFITNSPKISVKWKTGNDVHFPHVAETLVKGVDLYGRENGKWYYAGLGRPNEKQYNQSVLIRGMDTEMKEFMLNLPMYETVDSVFIGVIAGSEIKKPKRIFGKIKPIVFYGTSIVQGASAMRKMYIISCFPFY